MNSPTVIVRADFEQCRQPLDVLHVGEADSVCQERPTKALHETAEEHAEWLASIASSFPVRDRAGAFAHPTDLGVMCVPLQAGQVALIDAEDLPLVRPYSWFVVLPSGYAQTEHVYAGRTYSFKLHRLVLMLGTGSEMYVDHINHDPLDNRKSNLRLCTPLQNSFNQRRYSSNTSGIKGVCQRGGKWQAYVNKAGQRYQQLFDTKGQAEAWVRTKREELHGEFACHG